jgi:hypothetical protein
MGGVSAWTLRARKVETYSLEATQGWDVCSGAEVIQMG